MTTYADKFIETTLEHGRNLLKALKTQVGGDHYQHMAIQPIEFCQKNQLPMIESSVIKYVCRHKVKNGKQDIEKAIHLLNILLELEYPEKVSTLPDECPYRSNYICLVIRECRECPVYLDAESGEYGV